MCFAILLVGLLAFPCCIFGILPAKYDFLPASTPNLKASPISTGFSAWAMAVLTSTQSAPISIAKDASEGTANPASITTGTLAYSIIIIISSNVCMPLPEPIDEPSGITVEQPIDSSFCAKTGSALIYGNTIKPFLISSFAASKV